MPKLIDTRTPTVKAVDAIDMSSAGFHTIPLPWYAHMEGAPNKATACAILADLVFWYRSRIEYQEGTLEPVGRHKRFKADMLQRSRGYYEYLGISVRQERTALDFLANTLGVIRKELRRVGQLSNVRYIDLVPEVLVKISKHIVKEEVVQSESIAVDSLSQETIAAEGKTYTERTLTESTDRDCEAKASLKLKLKEDLDLVTERFTLASFREDENKTVKALLQWSERICAKLETSIDLRDTALVEFRSMRQNCRKLGKGFEDPLPEMLARVMYNFLHKSLETGDSTGYSYAYMESRYLKPENQLLLSYDTYMAIWHTATGGRNNEMDKKLEKHKSIQIPNKIKGTAASVLVQAVETMLAKQGVDFSDMAWEWAKEMNADDYWKDQTTVSWRKVIERISEVTKNGLTRY